MISVRNVNRHPVRDDRPDDEYEVMITCIMSFETLVHIYNAARYIHDSVLATQAFQAMQEVAASYPDGSSK